MISVLLLAQVVSIPVVSNVVHVLLHVLLDVSLHVILHVQQFVHILVIPIVCVLVVNNVADVVIFAILVYRCVLAFVLLNANLDVLIVLCNVVGGVTLHVIVNVRKHVMDLVIINVPNLALVMLPAEKMNVAHLRLLRRNMND